MGDFLVDLGANKTARDLIRRLGLPLPLPQKLKRTHGPWEERPLHDMAVIVKHLPQGRLRAVLAGTLAAAGANAWIDGDNDDLRAYLQKGEAFGRMPKRLEAGEKPAGLRPSCLIFDATRIEEPEELVSVYEFFHNHVRSLAPCGRALILARPPDNSTQPATAAASRALEGFTRSMAKEIGRKGATAQVVYVEAGADDRLEPLLRFLLSARSAYITGQPFYVSDEVRSLGDNPTTRTLHGKSALVTGGAQGIGAAIARALALEGARVIVMDRASEDGPTAAVAHEIGGIPLLCDITDPDATKTIREFLREGFRDNLDIIIHNAGITRDKMLVNMDGRRWGQTLDVNLNSLIRVNDALVRMMAPGGRIVCLASIAGIAGNTGQTNYAASKAGLIGYVQSVAPGLARKGIAVNAVAPGFIETRMTARIPAATREVARRLSSLSQGGLPKDVAETVTFLSGPGAAGLSGQVIRICGGNFIGA